jgi:hypothetical protein
MKKNFNFMTIRKSSGLTTGMRQVSLLTKFGDKTMNATKRKNSQNKGCALMANSRQNDPVTSRMAASEAEKSGRAASHRAICLDSVMTYPGQTAAEIARRCSLERHVPSRRLPELRERGLVINGEPRACAVTGRMSMIWLPTKGGAL